VVVEEDTPGLVVLDPLAEEALAAPPSADRTRLLRQVLVTPAGFTARPVAARALAALYLEEALDDDVVEGAFTADRRGRPTATRPGLATSSSAVVPTGRDSPPNCVIGTTS
jgi:hypothetical protein